MGLLAGLGVDPECAGITVDRAGERDADAGLLQLEFERGRGYRGVGMEGLGWWKV